MKFLAVVGAIFLVVLIWPVVGSITVEVTGAVSDGVVWVMQRRPTINWHYSVSPPPAPQKPTARQQEIRQRRVMAKARLERLRSTSSSSVTVLPSVAPTSSCEALPFDQKVECRRQRFLETHQ